MSEPHEHIFELGRVCTFCGARGVRAAAIGENWTPEKRGRALAFVFTLANSHHTEWQTKRKIWDALQEFKI